MCFERSTSMPYYNIVTGDNYIFKTLLPSILISKNLKGVYTIGKIVKADFQKHSTLDLYTDFTLVPLGVNHKNIWPLALRIDRVLIFLNGELTEPKGADYWRDYIELGEKYIGELEFKDSKLTDVKQLIITNEELDLETKATKIISWGKLLQEFSYDYRDDYAFKTIKERYTLTVGGFEAEREEDDLSLDVIKSMCRIHKDKLCVLFDGGTPALTMASYQSLMTKRYKYIISDNPLLANKEPETLIRGDIFLMIVNKKH